MTEAELKERMAVRTSFDFEHQPLYRIHLFRTEAALYLYVNFHHIVFDGTSLTVFMEDLEQAYQGKR